MVKIFLILGFMCLGGGAIILYEIFVRSSLDVPGNNRALRIWGLLFWYLEPVIGIFIFFAGREKIIKFFGAFFLITYLLAWIGYFSLK